MQGSLGSDFLSMDRKALVYAEYIKCGTVDVSSLVEIKFYRTADLQNFTNCQLLAYFLMQHMRQSLVVLQHPA